MCKILCFYLAFFMITLVASFNAKYNIGVQIAVEIELITVAGKLTNAPIYATCKLVPTINASTIETLMVGTSLQVAYIGAFVSSFLPLMLQQLKRNM